MDSQTSDMPLTAMCILAEKINKPARYFAVDTTYDTKTEIDLWKDSFFGKKINRFICFTKEFPIQDTFNVIEDVRLCNVGDPVPAGYIPLDKTGDTAEKAFQKKNMYIKISPRHFTEAAVCDIIALMKSKKAPIGYLTLGDINGYTLCVRYAKIPKPQKPVAPTVRDRIIAANDADTQPTPRPMSSVNGNAAVPNDYYKTVQRVYDAANNYYPLQGVPFEINPLYLSKNKSIDFDTDIIDRYASSNDILNKPPCGYNNSGSQKIKSFERPVRIFITKSNPFSFDFKYKYEFELENKYIGALE